MDRRRIIIGAFIGIIVFTFITSLGDKFWFQTNQLILNLESRISFNKKFSNKESIILDFNKESKNELLDETSNKERKEFFLKMISKLDKLTPLSINLVQSKENKIGIFQHDINNLQNQLNTPIQSIEYKDIELSWINENNKTVLLEHSINPIEIFDANEYQNGFIDEYKLRSKNIFLISPNLNLKKDNLNKLINYFEGRSLHFIGYSKVLLFLALMVYSILAAMMVYPARIAVFAIVSLIALISAQISYSFFNSYLEISTLILGLLVSLLTTNIFDINFQEIVKINFFKPEIADEFKNFQNKEYGKKQTQEPEAKPVTIDEDIIEDLRFDLKNKHYSELETKLEEIAVEFEEASFEKIDIIQDKLIDLLSDNQMSERDNLRLGLIKHNFDHLLGEIDRKHFNMTPLRSEAEQGFINVLEQLATKVYYRTKSKVIIQLESSINRLDIDSQEKINVYRILENIIEVIVQSNIDEINSKLEVKLQITEQTNDLLFNIFYQGADLNRFKSSTKMQDSYKRLSALKNGILHIENRQGVNYIKFTIKNIFSRKLVRN